MGNVIVEVMFCKHLTGQGHQYKHSYITLVQIHRWAKSGNIGNIWKVQAHHHTSTEGTLSSLWWSISVLSR